MALIKIDKTKSPINYILMFTEWLKLEKGKKTV